MVKQLTLQLSKRWKMKVFPLATLENAENVRKNLDKFPEIKNETAEQ
jgi:hypothetical protein